jgi:phosphoenolpyruvate carboxykinase (GTP)
VGQALEAKGVKLPKIYTTNWFRKGADGKFVWPGYGENMRVLKWILDRLDGTAPNVTESFFGITPTYDAMNWNGLNFSAEQFKTVTSIDKAAWATEMKLHDELFTQLAYHLPKELANTKARIEVELAA